MRLLTGQAIADSGELRVLGHELPRRIEGGAGRRWASSPSSTTSTSTSPSRTTSPSSPASTGSPDVGAAVDRALDLARLRDRRKDAVDELSGGMRRRLLLARGLVHDPQLVLLDEPTVGLDPQIRTELWTLIDDLRSRGQDDPDVDPLHRGGRAARRRGRGDGRRQGDRPRQARQAGRRARRRRTPPRSTGRRNGSPRCAPTPRRRPRGAGGRARRSRSSAPSAPTNGAIPEDAVVRAATLEDVFVLLTGEEAE